MSAANQMPEDKGVDHTLAMLKEGYHFIANRRKEFNSNVFKTRVLGRSAYCLSGSDAAELFYDESKFKRAGAAPLPVKKTLFGTGGIQSLDDSEHKHRKAMFMELWTFDAVTDFRYLTRHFYENAAQTWEQQGSIVLYDEVKKVLTQIVCAWAGVPLAPDEVPERASQLSELYEKAGEAGLSHFRGWIARSHAEKWIEGLIEDVREKRLNIDPDRALYKFAWYRGADGTLLEPNVAAVEVLNILRPTVANAVWVVFIALALHEFPQQAKKLKDAEQSEMKHFIQEVRRFYPFFPFTVAKTRKDFSWNGFEFKEGTLTLLDLYGTNHHPDDWKDPEIFDPQRFEGLPHEAFRFIPQGGGDYPCGHRCAGEWLTLLFMEETVFFLTQRIRYHLPEQDLSYSFSEIPSLPKSRIWMTNICSF